MDQKQILVKSLLWAAPLTILLQSSRCSKRGWWRHRGPREVSQDFFYEKSNLVKFTTLKIFFILVKISYYRALFTQKRVNRAN